MNRLYLRDKNVFRLFSCEFNIDGEVHVEITYKIVSNSSSSEQVSGLLLSWNKDGKQTCLILADNTTNEVPGNIDVQTPNSTSFVNKWIKRYARINSQLIHHTFCLFFDLGI